MTLLDDIQRALGEADFQRFLDEALDAVARTDAQSELAEAPAPDAPEASTLLAAIEDLDARREDGEDLRMLFDSFGIVGAGILKAEVPRFFDMKVETEDPALEAWVSGVMALRNR